MYDELPRNVSVTVVSLAPWIRYKTGMHRLGYRPTLDGLRGLSVLAVIVFHAWPALLPAGWLGVDVFFVLSGFLITSLLIAEHESTGGVSFGRFYARRALRLLPALAVVLPVAVGLAAVFEPSLLGATISEALASVFYVSNWLLGLTSDQHVVAGLVGHTWSLSIEEQFYLLWPLVICTLMRIGGCRLALYLTLVVVACIDIHRPMLATSGHATLWTDARADTLLIGSALALASSLGLTRPGRVARVVGGVGAMALVEVALHYTTIGDGWRTMADGGYTLIACAAASVVLAALSGWRLLAWEPLVRIGRISYGLYLYHYPVERILQDRLGTGPACLALTVVITFSVATLSYRYLERPFLRLQRRMAGPGPAVAVGIREAIPLAS